MKARKEIPKNVDNKVENIFLTYRTEIHNEDKGHLEEVYRITERLAKQVERYKFLQDCRELELIPSYITHNTQQNLFNTDV